MEKKGKIIYLDCSSGISGDMTVAALLDLGADPDYLVNTLKSLPLDGWRTEISNVTKSGLRVCDFNVILKHDNHDHDMDYLHGNDCKEHSYEKHSHEGHDHEGYGHEGHGHEEYTHNENIHENVHHHGRNLQDITEILQAGTLTAHALELALKIFRILAEAEASVHGKTVDQVHFHEVGAVDSIIDIAATAICLDNLQVQEVIIPSLNEGQGQIRCQHGLLPIPVPATAAIVQTYQLPLHITHVLGELVTPTGAAIAAAIGTREQLPQQFTIKKIGMGGGKRDYGIAGILRAMWIEEPEENREKEGTAEGDKETIDGINKDQVLVLESNLDDCTGEALGFVMEELFRAGALDVWYQPIFMKKNRPAYKLSILCKRQDQREMEYLVFTHTTAIGIRYYLVNRSKMNREIRRVDTPYGTAKVKFCTCEGKIYCYPENDSVAELARKNKKSFSELYHEIKTEAEKVNRNVCLHRKEHE